jgi:hypothetical protein
VWLVLVSLEGTSFLLESERTRATKYVKNTFLVLVLVARHNYFYGTKEDDSVSYSHMFVTGQDIFGEMFEGNPDNYLNAFNMRVYGPMVD